MIDLTYVFLVFVVAAGAGRRVLRWLNCNFDHVGEEVCFSLGTGLGLLALSVMILGLTRLLYSWSLYGVLLFWGVAGGGFIIVWAHRLWQRLRGKRPHFDRFSTYLTLLWVGSMFFGLVRALAPVHGAVDPLAYHLALPKIYLAKHFLSFERTITGSLYPANIEMLYVLGIGLRSAVMAQLVHFGFAVASSLAVFVFATRRFNIQTGLWSGAIFFNMPVLTFFSSVAYIDIGLCFFQILATWALLNWCRRRSRTDLILAAISTGLALGSKHSAIILALGCGGLVFAVTAVLEGRWNTAVKRTVVFVGISLLVAGPWYVRSYIESGNPVWPQMNSYFGGLTATQAEALTASTLPVVSQTGEDAARWTLAKVLKIPVYVPIFVWRWSFEFWGGVQRFAGCFFVALLPGIFLYIRRERALWGIAVFCYIYVTVTVLWMHANPRYALSGFAFLSVLCGYVAYRLSSSNFYYRIVFNSTFVAVFGWSVLWNYQMARPLWGVVIGSTPAANFLKQSEPTYAVFEHVNKVLPTTSTVLLQGMVKGYYCDRPYVWDHPNQALLVYNKYNNADELLQRIRELEISHIVRIRSMPAIRSGFYPDYFRDPVHMAFLQDYLSLLYMDEFFLLFEVSQKTSIDNVFRN